MAFRKFLSPLSIVGVVVLMFGLGIAVVGLQQKQDNRSHAATSGALGGACVNGWSGTCMDHNYPSTCDGTWVEGSYPWPCPNSGNSVWCCVPNPKYTISGTVFSDTNGNGTQDNGESGVSGVTVNNTIGTTTTTNSSGQYSFTGLTSFPTTGYPYGISISNYPANYTTTTANPVYLYLNNSNQTVNFGIAPPAPPPPPQNQAPTANTGADQTITLPTNSVTLNGSGSDPNGDTLSYTWTKSSGPSGGSITSPNSATTTVTGLQQGTYMFNLNVSDGKGGTDDDTITITVNAAANQAPTAKAGADQTITLPTSSVTLDGSGSSDPNGDTLSYTWTKSSGPSGASITSPNSATTTVTSLVQGTYVFKLQVADGKGGTANDTVIVTVSTAPTTTMNFTLFLHGIGKGGDNVLDNDPNHDPSTNTGTANPLHLQRSVTVEVHNPSDNSLVVSKPGVAIFNTTAGNFTISNLDMGPTLTTRTYKIIVIAQSLRGNITADITGGGTNTVPVMKLVNGDANQDGILNILDYNLIAGCVSDPDFGQTAADCDPTRAAKSDIDDDGKVSIFDLSLLIREFSVQAL